MTNDGRLTVGSLFSGIGGIDLGLERAGMESRWFVEWNAHCQNVLRRHWPGLPVYGDITAVDWGTVEPVDILAGGFPCQPVSAAGRQLAQEDDRWLWPAFAGAIRALRPRYVLVENVRNLLAVNGGSAFAEVLGDLASLGFDAEWDCIPASAVGAPHERDRLWLVAYPTAHGRGSGRSGRLDSGREGQPELALSVLADAERLGPSRPWQSVESLGARQWSVEPDVGRVADGVPHRVDRLRALGNAVVPQVVEWIGRRIVAFDESRRAAA